MQNPQLLHRINGYYLLSGNGLEIGALHQPANLQAGCSVKYFDVISKEEAAKIFTEISPSNFVNVDYIGNLDTEGLSSLPDNYFDFVIINHVFEHLANPMKILGEVFRIIKKGGKLVVSAPDKEYTFDKNRDLTKFSHLLEEYYDDVKEVTDDHYIDYIKGIIPDILKFSPEDIAIHVAGVKRRREHAHVWNSQSFEEFIRCSILILGIDGINIFKSIGSENNIEYFSVWKKL